MNQQYPNIISRRAFLKSVFVVSVVPLTSCSISNTSNPNAAWPKYRLSRPKDDLYIELTAKGFAEVSSFGRKCLRKSGSNTDQVLLFKFPPQHYAETAITERVEPVHESVLKSISLLPSESSSIALKLAEDFDEDIYLSLEELLDWEKFQLLLPDLDAIKSQYGHELSIPLDASTRIELPWGIELSPVDSENEMTWLHRIQPWEDNGWAAMWTTRLGNRDKSYQPIQLEILGARGFDTEIQQADGYSRIVFKDAPGVITPDLALGISAIQNYDRLGLVTSLSRRFEYTGESGPPPLDTAKFEYDSDFVPANTCLSACFEESRSLEVNQFRLSSRGGWLELDGNWDALPSCSLTGWTHSASLGRDNHVKLVNAGYLFPFGTPAILVIQTDRIFLKDEEGHRIALLLKQAFLQVPQPSTFNLLHKETVFQSLAVTTKRTPPLDLPANGDPASYQGYDFFLPMVDGLPFRFEHEGVDWSGNSHTSNMPMIFVSNRATSANGLIWEPGYSWSYQEQLGSCSPIETPKSRANSIPKTGEGLRLVDRQWNSSEYRFAQYGNSQVAVAEPLVGGDTDCNVEWVEWVRGPILEKEPREMVERPFNPRARTLKIQIPTLTQFSNQASWCLATYRDTRFENFPVLDPEPTTRMETYNANLSVERGLNPAKPYLHILETLNLVSHRGAVSPDPSSLSAQVRDIYYRNADYSSQISSVLFENISNEIAFGFTSSSDSTGGLCVPDTHVSTLTRYAGPLGDGTFNVRKWAGYKEAVKSKLEAQARVDFAEYSFVHKSQLDIEPFDRTLTQEDIDKNRSNARAVMGYSEIQYTPNNFSQPSISERDMRTGVSIALADMFGVDAQLLPGVSFEDLFREVLVTDPSGVIPPSASANEDAVAKPMNWNIQVPVLDGLLSLIGDGPEQISITDFADMILQGGQDPNYAEPAKIGVEATLDWSNSSFKTVELGSAVTFTPKGSTRFELSARVYMDLGMNPFSIDDLNFQIDPKDPEISSASSITDFSLTLFRAIEIEFNEISFDLTPDGRTDFNVDIAGVGFQGGLAFLSQMGAILASVGSDSEIDISVNTNRIRISQRLAFPPGEDQPLFIGPAMITNLTFGWAVQIPLRGREVMSASFELSSREKPLTIYVPPYYGGKAHVLMEVTTRGIRLLEISMEYGALIPITWGVATGEASLTAGLFYMVEKSAAGEGTVIFRAFVKASANLSIARIIHFSGLIYIGLSSENNGNVIRGQASITVSIKIGFVRISYSFTAEYSEEKRNSRSDDDDERSDDSNVAENGGLARSIEKICSSTNGILDSESIDRYSHEMQLYSPKFSVERREALERFLDGYRD